MLNAAAASKLMRLLMDAVSIQGSSGNGTVVRLPVNDALKVACEYWVVERPTAAAPRSWRAGREQSISTGITASVDTGFLLQCWKWTGFSPGGRCKLGVRERFVFSPSLNDLPQAHQV